MTTLVGPRFLPKIFFWKNVLGKRPLNGSKWKILWRYSQTASSPSDVKSEESSYSSTLVKFGFSFSDVIKKVSSARRPERFLEWFSASDYQIEWKQQKKIENKYSKAENQPDWIIIIRKYKKWYSFVNQSFLFVDDDFKTTVNDIEYVCFVIRIRCFFWGTTSKNHFPFGHIP